MNHSTVRFGGLLKQTIVRTKECLDNGEWDVTKLGAHALKISLLALMKKPLQPIRAFEKEKWNGF